MKTLVIAEETANRWVNDISEIIENAELPSHVKEHYENLMEEIQEKLNVSNYWNNLKK